MANSIHAPCHLGRRHCTHEEAGQRAQDTAPTGRAGPAATLPSAPPPRQREDAGEGETDPEA